MLPPPPLTPSGKCVELVNISLTTGPVPLWLLNDGAGARSLGRETVIRAGDATAHRQWQTVISSYVTG